MKYKVNYEIEDLINVYSKRWAFVWLQKYHPEVLTRAKKELEELARSYDDDPEKFCEAMNSNGDD